MIKTTYWWQLEIVVLDTATSLLFQNIQIFKYRHVQIGIDQEDTKAQDRGRLLVSWLCACWWQFTIASHF